MEKFVEHSQTETKQDSLSFDAEFKYLSKRLQVQAFEPLPEANYLFCDLKRASKATKQVKRSKSQTNLEIDEHDLNVAEDGYFSSAESPKTKKRS